MGLYCIVLYCIVLYCIAGHVLSQGSTNFTSFRPGKKNHLSGPSLWWRLLLTTKEGGKKGGAGSGDVHEGTLYVASFSPKYPFTILAPQINKNSGENFKIKFTHTMSRKWCEEIFKKHKHLTSHPNYFLCSVTHRAGRNWK